MTQPRYIPGCITIEIVIVITIIIIMIIMIIKYLFLGTGRDTLQ